MRFNEPNLAAKPLHSTGDLPNRRRLRRLVEGKSIRLNDSILTDPKAELTLTTGEVLHLDKKHAVRIG